MEDPISFEFLSQIAGVLYEAGAFAQPVSEWKAWLGILMVTRKEIEDRSGLQLGEGHFDEAELFDDERPDAQARFTRQRAHTAPPADLYKGPEELWALRACNYDNLVMGDHWDLPGIALARFTVYFGDMATQQDRDDPLSDVRVGVEMLKGCMCRYYLVEPAQMQGGVMARKMAHFLSATATSLPPKMCEAKISTPIMQAEVMDAMSWHRGTSPEKRDVELQRLRHMTSHPTMTNVNKLAERFDNSSELTLYLDKLAHKYGHSGDSLYFNLCSLNDDLDDDHRGPLLEEALNKTNESGQPLSGSEVVQALIVEQTYGQLGAATAPGSADGWANSTMLGLNPGTTLTGVAPSKDNIRESLEHVNFRAAVQAGETCEGLELLEVCALSGSMLISKQFFSGTTAFAGAHPLLGRLALLHPDRRQYFATRMVQDLESGIIPDLLRTYDYNETELGYFLGFQWHKMDGVNSKRGGFLRIRELLTASKWSEVPESEFYTVEECLSGLRPFFKALWTAAGFPASVDPADGFSIETALMYQSQYIQYANGFEAEISREWRQEGNAKFREMLERSGQKSMVKLTAVRLVDQEFGPICKLDDPWHVHLANKIEMSRSLTQVRLAFPSLMSNPTVQLSGTTLSNRGVRNERGAGGGRGARSSGGSGGGRGGHKSGRGSDGRGAAADASKRKQPATAAGPGSKAHLAMPLSDGQFFMAGSVFSPDDLAAKYGFDKNKKCLPVLLSNKPGAAALELCPNHATHGGLNTEWHKRPNNFNLQQCLKQFGKKATASQCQEAGWTAYKAKKI